MKGTETHPNLVTPKLGDHDINMCTLYMQEDYIPTKLKVTDRELPRGSKMLVKGKLSLKKIRAIQQGLGKRYQERHVCFLELEILREGVVKVRQPTLNYNFLSHMSISSSSAIQKTSTGSHPNTRHNPSHPLNNEMS